MPVTPCRAPADLTIRGAHCSGGSVIQQGRRQLVARWQLGLVRVARHTPRRPGFTLTAFRPAGPSAYSVDVSRGSYGRRPAHSYAATPRRAEPLFWGPADRGTWSAGTSSWSWRGPGMRGARPDQAGSPGVVALWPAFDARSSPQNALVGTGRRHLRVGRQVKQGGRNAHLAQDAAELHWSASRAQVALLRTLKPSWRLATLDCRSTSATKPRAHA
jgi:hypothetical protein